MTKPKREKCGRGHDLTIEANLVHLHGRLPECRICKRMTNARYYQRARVHTKCEACGKDKAHDKRRTCGPCRWKMAQIREKEDPRGPDLRRAVEEAVALELAPPWEKKAAKEKRDREAAELRAQLRSVVTAEDDVG